MPLPAEGLASRLFLGPALRTQPDRRLVTLVREGYEAAFEEIVRRYGRPLGRYAASIVGGRSEDVLQDAFAKALPALQRDGAEVDLRPWLFRIVRNTALNDLRDSPPSPELLAEMLAGGRNPADELEQREELADLMRRLKALPEAQRAAIVMRELEGLGHEEIAAALGLTDGGARQAIYRARQALRDGAGMLLPLPLVRLLVDHGGDAAGAGAGGAVVAASASAGGAGVGGAVKFGVVAVVVAGSVGAGVVAQDHRRGGAADAQPVHTASKATTREVPAAPAQASVAIASSGQPRSDRRRQGPDQGSGDGGGGNSLATPPGEAEKVSRLLGDRGGPPPSSIGGSRSHGRNGEDGRGGERHGGRRGDDPVGHGEGSESGGRGGHSGPGRDDGGESGGSEHRGEGSDGGGSGASSGQGSDGSSGSDRSSGREGGGSGSDDGPDPSSPPPPEGEPEGPGGSDDAGGGSSHSGPGSGGEAAGS